jgi:branched-chain amino acid transport system ATP-binding protein
VLVFNQGHTVASGNPSDVVNDPAVIEAYLGRRREKRRRA